MTTQAVLMKEIESLPENRLSEVLDFVGYLKQQETRQAATGELCPACARYYDPGAEEPPFNAETIAAFREGEAMLRGERPAQWHHSIEDLDSMLGL